MTKLVLTSSEVRLPRGLVAGMRGDGFASGYTLQQRLVKMGVGESKIGEPRAVDLSTGLPILSQAGLGVPHVTRGTLCLLQVQT